MSCLRDKLVPSARHCDFAGRASSLDGLFGAGSNGVPATHGDSQKLSVPIH